MYLSKAIVFVVATLFTTTFAAPAADPVAEPAPVDAELAPRGFGCPFNRYQCNDHVRCPRTRMTLTLSNMTQCKSLGGGRTGGYCAGALRT